MNRVKVALRTVYVYISSNTLLPRPCGIRSIVLSSNEIDIEKQHLFDLLTALTF